MKNLILFFMLGPLAWSQTTVAPKTTIAAKTTLAASIPVTAPVFKSIVNTCALSGPSCMITASIASGDLAILPLAYASGGFSATSATASNGDVLICLTATTDAGGGRVGQICYGVATSAWTSVTVSGTYSSGTIGITVEDCSNPAGLPTATILDKNIGAQNEGVTAWTSGTTATTTNPTDFFFSFYYTNTGTYSAPSCTNRTFTSPFQTEYIQDQTTAVVGALSCTATLSASGFGPGVGAAFL